jgi:hypothetical protein
VRAAYATTFFALLLLLAGVCLVSFGCQRADVNIGLTAINLLLTLADFIKDVSLRGISVHQLHQEQLRLSQLYSQPSITAAGQTLVPSPTVVSTVAARGPMASLPLSSASSGANSGLNSASTPATPSRTPLPAATRDRLWRSMLGGS